MVYYISTTFRKLALFACSGKCHTTNPILADSLHLSLRCRTWTSKSNVQCLYKITCTGEQLHSQVWKRRVCTLHRRKWKTSSVYILTKHQPFSKSWIAWMFIDEISRFLLIYQKRIQDSSHYDFCLRFFVVAVWKIILLALYVYVDLTTTFKT